jgi:hypothetical protein
MSATTDIAKFLKDCFKVFDKFGDKEAMTAIAAEAANMIRTRTRLGYGVPGDNAPRQKLKVLSDSYKLFRRKHKDELYDEASPAKSNLTFTGQLLNSLKVKKISKDSAIVGASGKRQGEQLTNDKLAEYVEENGRPFLYLSNLENKKLETFARKTFGDLIKRANI